ncbi:MAG: glycosyltransferase family 9 protein [Bacteroidales bacterium]|nr:glycosyltransferase family 9 protein [Bacteroidales bacterium]
MALAYKAIGKFDSPYARVAINKDEINLQTAQPTASETEKVKTILSAVYPLWEEKKIIIFNINASDMLPQRKWMLGSFIQTALTLLAKQENILIVATGTKEEKTYVQTFIDGVGDSRCVSVAGEFCLRQLVALYVLSTCILSNDSGPAHFVSAIPLKTFVLFGPETPELYMPLGDVECFYAGLVCSPCVSAANHRKTDCSQPLCMQSISVEEVSSSMIDYIKSID